VIFRQFLHEDRSCASYLIGCASKGVTAIVDPKGDLSLYESQARHHGLEITDVIDTHVHADHLSGAHELAERTGAKLRMGIGADVNFGFEPVADGDVIDVGNRHIRVIHTPGHTSEHVCLLVDDWFVLTGDTLFVGDVGRVDLALSEVDENQLRNRARQLHSSLQKLAALPRETEVYPGHYAGSTCGRGMDGKTISTVGRELRTNRALGLDVDDFIELQLSNIPPLPEDFLSIKRTNVGVLGNVEERR
jgi:glyoxylase-like metal-dependent hydrolase (beta-lactamase superfamily II)